jgi:ribose-phosphate pyrophosphokinase
MNKLHITTRSSDIISFQYPMGEWQLRLSPQLAQQVERADEVYINAQVQSSDDWVKLLLLVDAIRGKGWKSIKIALPYLPYSRADRRFCTGDCLGSEVFLKSLFYSTSGYTLDAHNSIITRQYGVKNVSPERFITKSIIDISLREKVKKIGLIFPDKGASERYALPDTFGSNSHAVTVTKYYGVKERDAETGKITGLALPKPSEDIVLVVDDICDGGRTFSEVANLLSPQTKYLYITHGIFSQGPSPLAAYRRVYTTDSIDRTRVSRPAELNSQFLGKLHEFNSSEVIWDTL